MHLRLRKVRRTGRRGGGRGSLHWRFYVVCTVKEWLVRIEEYLKLTQRTIPGVSIKTVVTVWTNTILVARAGLPFQASQCA